MYSDDSLGDYIMNCAPRTSLYSHFLDRTT